MKGQIPRKIPTGRLIEQAIESLNRPITNKGFPGGSAVKESTCNAGDAGSIPGSERSPGGGHGNPPQYSCLENPYGERSLEGCSPCCHKESDTTL